MLRTASIMLIALVSTGCTESVTDEGEDDGWDVLDGAKADDPSSSSYGALAALRVPPSFDATMTSLAAFNDTTLPHEAKALRKQIAETRDFVDLFSYAYSDAGPGDPWKDVREDLDEGYEKIGSFKDLFDTQGLEDPADAVYDDDEVAERRAVVLDWQEGFTARADAYRAYLARPQRSKLTKRDKDDLSPFFWGEAKIEPTLSRTGLKNISRLERALLELAQDDLDVVADIGRLTKSDNATTFHDFRKRVRSAVRVVRYFPAIVKTGHDPAPILTLLDDLVSRYGAIEDKLVKLEEITDNSDAEDLEDEIDDDWEAVKDWQKDEDIDEALDDLHDMIRK